MYLKTIEMYDDEIVEKKAVKSSVKRDKKSGNYVRNVIATPKKKRKVKKAKKVGKKAVVENKIAQSWTKAINTKKVIGGSIRKSLKTGLYYNYMG